MSSPPDRRVVGVLAWIAATATATVFGLFAIGAVGDGILDEPSRVLSQAEVGELLAAAPAPVVPGPDVPAPPTEAPASPTGAAPEVLASPGGSVLARCSGTTAEIVSASPAQGFSVDDRERADVVTFDADDNDVTVRVTCTDGRPVAQVLADGGDDDD